jgi:O-antigen/teichoic acid export membrane protein
VTVVTMLLVWGAAAAVGVVLGLLQLRTRPAVRQTWQWIRTHRDLGPAFATDALANRGAEQLVNIGVGILAGLSAVGALTAARTLYAPLTTIQTGVNTFLMPEVARRSRAGDSATVARLVALMSLAMGGFMFIMGLLLWLVPTAWGEVVFASTWGLARPVLIPMASFSAANAVSFGYWAGLKALGRGRTVLVIRAVGGAALVLAAGWGAVLGGAVGGAWGMTVATAGTAFWLAWAFHRAPLAGDGESTGSARTKK